MLKLNYLLTVNNSMAFSPLCSARSDSVKIWILCYKLNTQKFSACFISLSLSLPIMHITSLSSIILHGSSAMLLSIVQYSCYCRSLCTCIKLRCMMNTYVAS